MTSVAVKPETLFVAAVRDAMAAVQVAGQQCFDTWQAAQLAERHYVAAVTNLRMAVYEANEKLQSEVNWVSDLLQQEPKTLSQYLKDNSSVHDEAVEALRKAPIRSLDV